MSVLGTLYPQVFDAILAAQYGSVVPRAHVVLSFTISQRRRHEAASTHDLREWRMGLTLDSEYASISSISASRSSGSSNSKVSGSGTGPSSGSSEKSPSGLLRT